MCILFKTSLVRQPRPRFTLDRSIKLSAREDRISSVADPEMTVNCMGSGMRILFTTSRVRQGLGSLDLTHRSTVESG